MSTLLEDLKNRFGQNNVQITHFNKQDASAELKAYPFIKIDVQMRSKITVLMTNGLSDYKMPVLEKFKGKEHNELYFCLPSYWDLEDWENPNMNWVYEALFRFHNYLLDKQTWFGVGHTIPFKNPIEPISPIMKQSYFFFNDPLFLKEELIPIQKEDKLIHFLGIIPIFEDEFDYKIGKGTFKFQKKIHQQDVTELLDDFRSTVLKSKWRFFSK